jgi:ATP-dependent protease Clp ATPase subunit
MNESEPTCSFCHQPKSRVGKLIVGTGQVAICNYCVALCCDVLRQEGFDMTFRDKSPGNKTKDER